jgi:hypothetical protein
MLLWGSKVQKLLLDKGFEPRSRKNPENDFTASPPHEWIWRGLGMQKRSKK